MAGAIPGRGGWAGLTSEQSWWKEKKAVAAAARGTASGRPSTTSSRGRAAGGGVDTVRWEGPALCLTGQTG